MGGLTKGVPKKDFWSSTLIFPKLRKYFIEQPIHLTLFIGQVLGRMTDQRSNCPVKVEIPRKGFLLRLKDQQNKPMYMP